MKRNRKIFLLVVAVLVAIVFLIFIVIGLRFEIDNMRAKKDLSQEISNLPVPNTCSETSRRYEGNFETGSYYWYIDYKCATNGKSAYDYVINHLAARGYQAKADHSKSVSNEGIDYTFTYKSNNFVVDYFFNGVDDSPVFNADEKELLENHSVNSITVWLSKSERID